MAIERKRIIMIEKIFVGKDENIPKKVYYWTVLSGIVYSGSSYLMFLICSQLLGAYQAGIFSLSMSVGQQLVTIGYFNTRAFQVSDIRGQFAFSDYFVSKIITATAMVIVCIVWIIVGGFTREKAIVVLWITLFKCGEAIADVCQGLYQQNGRYDISGRCVFYETVLCIGAFGVAVFISRNLIVSVSVLAVIYVVSVLIIEGRLVTLFGKFSLKFDFQKQKALFHECLPLFINSFILMYINNAAKYALDLYETPEMLAAFNTIFMVAFVINLLAGFILKPVISVMAEYYANHEWNQFVRIIVRQLVLILGITILCISGAYLLGIPVLSAISGIDLSGYRMILCLILFGGAFNAIYQVFQYAIIIMRKQYACFWGSVVAAVITTLLVFSMVKVWGITGATLGYVVTMILLASIYAVMTYIFCRKSLSERAE